MENETEDAALWLAATSGTPRSFGDIFMRYQKRVLAVAYRHVQDFHQAEEAVSIVFLELWRLRSKVRIVDGSLLPWILSVTNYTCLNLSRAKRRQQIFISKLPPPSPAVDAAVTAQMHLEADETRLRLWQAMTKLNDRERLIVSMCLVDEIPVSAAATALNIPVPTAKTRLHRARKKLQTELASLAPKPTGGESNE